MSTKIKVERSEGYTVMSNHHLRNKKMTLKAKGLMSFMLSLPETWDYTEMGLVSVLKEGREAVRSGLRELEINGYLVREKRDRSEGKFGGYEYTLYEEPHRVGFSASVEPSTVEPLSDNHTQISTNKTITDKQLLINNKYYGQNEAFELFWSMYPKKNGKKPSKDKFIRIISKRDDLAHVIINDVCVRKETENWLKQNGKYVPNPVTYLNQERWQDPIDSMTDSPILNNRKY